jgi:hypothetical protein
MKLKQSNFERNAKKILGFEHFSLQIRDLEKNCLLIMSNEMPKILILTHTPYNGITLVFYGDLVVRARQLASL